MVTMLVLPMPSATAIAPAPSLRPSVPVPASASAAITPNIVTKTIITTAIVPAATLKPAIIMTAPVLSTVPVAGGEVVSLSTSRGGVGGNGDEMAVAATTELPVTVTAVHVTSLTTMS